MHSLIEAFHHQLHARRRAVLVLSAGLMTTLGAVTIAAPAHADSVPAAAAPVADHQPVRPAWLAKADAAKTAPVAASASASADASASASDSHVPVRPAWLAKADAGSSAADATAADVSSPALVDAVPAGAPLADRVRGAWGQRLQKIGARVREAASWTEHGVATWYGSWHKGRRTSSGAIFDPRLMTAAHPSLPLGTRLLVTNTVTGDSVVVVVNDREPEHERSIIDLSRGAAVKLGFVSAGRAAVKLTRLEPGQNPVEVADAPDDVTGTQPAPQGATMGLPDAASH